MKPSERIKEICRATVDHEVPGARGKELRALLTDVLPYAIVAYLDEVALLDTTRGTP